MGSRPATASAPRRTATHAPPRRGQAENAWLGVACEPNCVFIVCNQFPLLGFRFEGLRPGTNRAREAADSYRAAWARAQVPWFAPGPHHGHCDDTAVGLATPPGHVAGDYGQGATTGQPPSARRRAVDSHHQLTAHQPRRPSMPPTDRANYKEPRQSSCGTARAPSCKSPVPRQRITAAERVLVAFLWITEAAPRLMARRTPWHRRTARSRRLSVTDVRLWAPRRDAQ
ncbi:hypothetical protein ACIPSJ_40415 [Streptomyces sp. NPDC090088]|uniref:linalool dehydratase/isomerase domain-containing protein n=1 Tax=Streptomyces sp. NPDC090088 TaxID=3365944 RepID=UPI00381546C4